MGKYQISKSKGGRVKPGTPTGRPACRPSSAKYKFHCAYIFRASFVLLDIVVSKLHYHKRRGTMWGICLKIKETNLMMCGTYFWSAGLKVKISEFARFSKFNKIRIVNDWFAESALMPQRWKQTLISCGLMHPWKNLFHAAKGLTHLSVY